MEKGVFTFSDSECSDADPEEETKDENTPNEDYEKKRRKRT